MVNGRLKQLALTLLFAPTLALGAGTCLVVHDPIGLDGQASLFHTSTNILKDPDCLAIVFYPPIFALGSYDEESGIQKIPLSDASRKELQNFFLIQNPSSDLRFFDYSPNEMKKFLARLKDKEKIYKSFFEFHGSAQKLVDTPAPSDTYSSYRAFSAYVKDELTAADLMLIAQSNPAKVSFLKEKLKKLPTGSWTNPCAHYAREFIKQKDTRLPSSYSLAQEEKKLLEEYDSTLFKNKCDFYTRAKDLLKRHHRGPRPSELCEIQKKYHETLKNLTTCYYDNFQYNYIDSRLLTAHEGGFSLVASCAVGIEGSSLIMDSLEILKGCPKEKREIETALIQERKGNSQKSADRLCQGASAGVKFTVSLDVTYSDAAPSSLMNQLRIESDEDKVKNFDLTATEKLFEDLHEKCDNDAYKASKSIAEWRYGLHHAQADPKSSTNLKIESYTKLLDALNCESTKVLSPEEQKKLREDLVFAHTTAILGPAILIRSAYIKEPHAYGNSLEIKKTDEIYASTAGKIKDQYDRLDLSTHDNQVKALQRYLFLQEENMKATGFYDCYQCSGDSKAEKIPRSSLKKAFALQSYIGDSDDFLKAKDLRYLHRVVEAAANNAEKKTPAFCKRKIPECTFGDCSSDKKHSNSN